MDFRLGPVGERLREQTSTLLDSVLTPEMVEHCHRTGTNHDPAFAAALRAGGWLTLDVPVSEGGQGRGPLEVLAHFEELQRRDAPFYAIGTTASVAHVLQNVGTDWQRSEVLPKAMAAETLIAFGITEPENGSDAAAASTRAVRDGDHWVINGSKMFTTNAHIADLVFLLARTDPSAAKHAGLTTFLVPLDAPGVEVQAVHTLSGERTNITYYNDVRVEDKWRVGEVNQGWKVMGILLADEHTTAFTGEHHRLVQALRSWTADNDDPSAPEIAERVGRARTDLEICRLLQRRAVWLDAVDSPDHGRGSMSKLFSSERLQQQADEVLKLVGPDGLRERGDRTALEGGRFEHTVRHSPGTRIYAGTSEIHRNIIAQQVLGLPRPR